MKSLFILAVCCWGTLAKAEPRPEDIVTKRFLKPWVEREDELVGRKARPMRSRLRMLDETPRTDGEGKTFFAFAIDQRPLGSKDKEENWRPTGREGCVYPAGEEVYLQGSNGYIDARRLLGKRRVSPPRAGVCRES